MDKEKIDEIGTKVRQVIISRGECHRIVLDMLNLTVAAVNAAYEKDEQTLKIIKEKVVELLRLETRSSRPGE